MNRASEQELYLAEPGGRRLIEWIYDFARDAIRVYWEIAIALPVTIISMALALLFSAVAVADLFHKSQDGPVDMIALAISIPFLLSRRFRVFFWTWFACQIGWVLLLVAVIGPFTGFEFRAKTNVVKLLIAVGEFLPPLFFSFCIRRMIRKPI